MFFDRESTVVITKFNNLSESVLTNYCKSFGNVLRCFIKTSNQTRNKDPYALIKFAEASSVTSILSHRNHTINGVHVAMRSYHPDTSNSGSIQTLPSLMSLTQQNPPISNKNNEPKPVNYDRIIQENHALKHEITNLQKSLVEAQTYSKTAYDTFQVLREKFEVEQALTNKLKLEYTAMVESYEARLKQLSSSSSSVSSSIKATEKNKIKEEPIDSHSEVKHSINNSLEMQIIKDHLEQAQIDLGKSQTENALLNAKLISREQQFDMRFKELNNQYVRMKKQYEHLSSCIKDFHAKLYPKKRLKSELKEDNMNKSDRENTNKTNDSNEDIVEIIMQVDPVLP
ncbi:unnamed protein product [Rotaria sordida]|uniref:RRM domain-containing protein n=1 Tax=Rotaria sordida TaxID=392033 RepID=A0A813RFM1_9BILA|nr:unnamed protein product [Rotaria sordida]